MADGSSIEWTDATWNPVRGCSRVSDGCRNCYAERVAARFSDPGQPYHGLADRERAGSKWTGAVRIVAEHLVDPIRWSRPRRIFVNSMSDLFHERLANEEIGAVFAVMAAAPQHTFQVLTKRPKRMREWFEWVRSESGQRDYGKVLSRSLELIANQHARADARFLDEGFLCAINNVVNGYSAWPSQVGDGNPLDGTQPRWPLPNVWLGVSVENQAAADERIPELLATPAAVRFLSCEPLLGSVELLAECIEERANGTTALGWVIAGCESGPGARPCSVEWLRSLRDQCASASVPFFLKQSRPDELGYGGDELIPLTTGVGSVRQGGAGAGTGIIKLPYLDGVQHKAFPEASP